MLLAMLPARFVVPSALPAKLEAWLNLSQREKASVFIIVRTSAMTAARKKKGGGQISNSKSYTPKKALPVRVLLTNKRQPQQLKPHNCQNSHQDPPNRLHIQRQPEETAVGGVDDLGARFAALKHPLRLARLRINFVPPAQPNETASGNVFQVVKVGGEK